MAPPSNRSAGGLLSRVKDVGRNLLDLVYPPQCPGCARVGELFCEQCRSAVQAYPPAACPRCGRIQASKSLCAECTAEQARIDAIYPATIYTHPMREAIQSYKYNNVQYLAGPLAHWLVAAWHSHGLAADLLLSPLMVDRAVVLNHGEIAAVGPLKEVLTGELLSRVFATKASISWGNASRVCADFGP